MIISKRGITLTTALGDTGVYINMHKVAPMFSNDDIEIEMWYDEAERLRMINELLKDDEQITKKVVDKVG